MPNPYQIDTTESNLLGPMIKLQVLYERMPETTGCEKCKEINGDNAFWCCLSQSPSMYFVEFIKVWREVEKHWSKRKRLDLILRAIRNYLDNSDNKGCIFFDNGCTCYNERPTACRFYSVISDKNWNLRVDSLKKRFGDDLKIANQCNLVSIKGKPVGEKMDPEDEDLWFAKTKEAEQQLGVPKHFIELHDNPGGSYRTFHDHLLLELFPLNFLSMLTKVRLSNPSKEDIDATLKFLEVKMIEEGIVK